jgi:iron-only hydrogenase group A
LQNLALEYRLDEQLFINLLKSSPIDNSSPSIMKDDSKCIRCTRCVRTCADLQGVSALAMSHKGRYTKMSTYLEKPLANVICTNCGQCINRCPTGALTEKSYVEQVWDAIYDPSKFVVVQTAPAVRVSVAELFHVRPGARVTGKMVASLRAMGFDAVLDTEFTADLTIMEESAELLARLKKRKANADKSVALPMFSSCSPGWIKFVEHQYPEVISNLSTCKSPQQMLEKKKKTYYAKKREINPANVVSVSIMPCTAKKFEANRPEMRDSGFKDVDYVLTTREYASMIHHSGIDVITLKNEEYDTIMGASTGAGMLFGVTGGVTEAIIRTVYETVTGREAPFEGLNITPVRGFDGIKQTSILIEDAKPDWNFLEGIELKVAVVHGLNNVHKLMEGLKEGAIEAHFIEVMACPGGCIGGGGQPIPTNIDIRAARAEGTYKEDAKKTIRKAHENPEVIALYKEFLGKPNGHLSHELLNTYYTERSKY